MTEAIPTRNWSWYALQVLAKCESRVSIALRGKGYDEFPALYLGQRKWADRVKESEFALFPGYVFCRLNPSERLLPVLTIPGVRKIVGAGSVPIAIADEEIAAIQAVIRSGLPSTSVPLINVGARVLVERGPLKGIEGIVLSTDKKYRLAISVELLQRSVVVELEREWARPISNQNGPQSIGAVAGLAQPPRIYSLGVNS
ncbi:MAG TPA: transcription termination/antitermination NusG family protein [Bryobacteraceae bacterium]|jgi:transcription antitermination factor NusG